MDHAHVDQSVYFSNSCYNDLVILHHFTRESAYKSSTNFDRGRYRQRQARIDRIFADYLHHSEQWQPWVF